MPGDALEVTAQISPAPHRGPDAPAIFEELVTALHHLKDDIINSHFELDASFVELHQQLHQALGSVLVAHRHTFRGTVEQAVSEGVTRALLPTRFRLSSLGLQVRDVAGSPVAPSVWRPPPPANIPALRVTILKPGMVVTVEPGLVLYSDVPSNPLPTHRFHISQLVRCGSILMFPCGVHSFTRIT